MAESINELKEKIAKLESIGEAALAAQYRAELAKREAAAPKTGTPTIGDIVLGVNEQDFLKAGSKFATPDLHRSVFGMPYWKQAGVSLAFPCTIVDGNDANKESEITGGVSKEAAWKIKEILTALGVSWKVTNGLVSFNPADVAGKYGMVLWTQQRDSRSVDEGGKGTVYTKPISVYPDGATLESIGMSRQSLLLRDIA